MLNCIDAISAVDTKAKLEVRSGRVKKVRRQPELEEQAALADKTVIDGIRIGEFLIHIPNEGGARAEGEKGCETSWAEIRCSRFVSGVSIMKYMDK